MTKKVVEKEIVQQVYDVPEEELEEYRAAFRLYDKDNSGTISTHEFYKVLRNLGQKISKEEAQELVNELDQDQSGEISFDEFVTYMVSIKIEEEVDDDEIIRAFQTFDSDKDDMISGREFKYILCNLTDGDNNNDRFSESEADRLFNAADIDKDGFLNYREFVMFWKNKLGMSNVDN